MLSTCYPFVNLLNISTFNNFNNFIIYSLEFQDHSKLPNRCPNPDFNAHHRNTDREQIILRHGDRFPADERLLSRASGPRKIFRQQLR